MWKWLKKKIGQWVLGCIEDSKPLSFEIEVWLCPRDVGAQPTKLTATGTQGLALVCDYPETDNGFEGSRLVRVEDVENPAHWHRLWKHFRGKTPTWDDGTPFDFNPNPPHIF